MAFIGKRREGKSFAMYDRFLFLFSLTLEQEMGR